MYWKKHKGFILQLIFAAICLGFIIQFLFKEKAEVKKIVHILAHTDLRWLALGIGLCFLQAFWQGLMYVLAFRTIGASIKITDAIALYLKRNTAGVFMPAGGVTSLALFAEQLERKGISKEQSYAGSSIYGFCGILTVAIIAIPTLGYLSLHSAVLKSEVASLVGVLALLAAIAALIVSGLKKGLAYRLLAKFVPSLPDFMERIRRFTFSKKYFVAVVGFSMCVEFTGVAYLYTAMHAADDKVSLFTAVVGYAIAILVYTISPFMEGTGAVEIVLVFILKSFGYTTSQAVSITLIFRFFQFWFIILMGIVPLVTQNINRLKGGKEAGAG